MTIFFTHTEQFKFCCGCYYSTENFSNKTIKRYSNFCNKLIIGARCEDILIENASRYSKLEDTKLQFSKIDYDSKMFERIKENVLNSDFIIARLPSLFGLIAIYYAKKHNKPVYVEVVGNAFEALWYHSIKGKLIAYPFQMLTKLAVRKADFVSYITEKYLQEVYPTSRIAQGGLANIAIEDSFFTDEILSNRITKIKNDKKIKLGMIANLMVKYKGHKEVLIVFSKLCKEFSNLELELVGGGSPERISQLIKQLNIENKVQIKGTIPNDKIFAWLDGVDIYLQPSKTEAHGRSVIEAMSRGCTVVTSDVGGMRETISKDFRFKLNDLDSFYGILDNVISNTDIRTQQAYVNIEQSKQFKASVIDRKRNDFFSQIINAR